ncbi:PEP-CTERM sorting domain-containing protein [Paucibacter sp. R3-3]|uniref:PEP-CTERM sorting domain-containing protein n=1 Tax=Roseateles agri TaxID=3098619 RepID=A0ABU5DDJ0_9BURK|nr:PEP-CTERM sorting domain-containing protein [Paucibacter sp. R3-3]MDY0743820.1 PEP-CTERM sorting domain-containing protein [Paucibacter sp. R3-3]
MKKTVSVSLALLLASLAAAASAADAPTILNGSFEDNQLAGPGTSTGTIADWIKTFHGPIALVNGDLIDNYGNSYGVTPFGNQYVGLDPITTGFRAGITQIVDNFVAGQTYALTLYVADSDGGKAPLLDVMFSDGGATVYQETSYNVPVGGPYGDVIDFTKVTTLFTAPVSGEIAISLFNNGSAYVTTDPGSISIDNVSIALAAPVPEPTSAALLAVGLLAVGGRQLSRRRKA